MCEWTGPGQHFNLGSVKYVQCFGYVLDSAISGCCRDKHFADTDELKLGCVVWWRKFARYAGIWWGLQEYEFGMGVAMYEKREKAVEMQYILMELPETERGQNPIESKMW